MIELNEQQQRAVTSTAPSILCLAGPGSGKTRVLIERIRHLVFVGSEDPRKFVAITFTNAAANVLTSRLDGIQLGFCGTLHSFTLRLLREHGAAVGFGPGLTVLDADQARRMRDQCMREAKLVATAADLDAAVLEYPNRIRNGINPNSQSHAVLGAARFHQALLAANLCTFDTLLAYGLRLLQEQPECTAQFRHLLWDEFNDSNDMDAEILLALSIPNKFVVGDPDQSVMGFRGGNMQNIVELARRADTEVITLELNYRCSSRICAAANRLIEHNLDRVPKRTTSATDESGVCNVTAHSTEAAELEWLCAGVRVEGPGNCAVLLRINPLVDRFAAALRGAGIPVAETRYPVMPVDWGRAKLLIQLLADPENDTLALWWLETLHPPAVAQRFRLLAQAAGQSLNQQTLKIPRGTPLDALPAALARAGIGVETLNRIKIVCPGAACEDLGGLVLAMSAAETESKTVGEGVTVSTIHAAKGTEHGVVFLPAFEEEVIPGLAKSRDVEEERRLAFVTVTRARHTLCISHAAERMPSWAATTPKPATPSRFIQEMGL